jgi:hypothetical protein
MPPAPRQRRLPMPVPAPFEGASRREPVTAIGRRALLVSRAGCRAFCSSCCSGSSCSGCWPTAPKTRSRRYPSVWWILRGGSYTPPRTSGRGSRSSCATGSWSTARSSATGPTSARTTPPTTCAVPRTSSCARTAGRAPTAPPANDRGVPHESLRPRTGTLTLTARQRRRTVGSSVTTRASSPSRAPATACDQGRSRTQGARAAHGLLRLDGLGGRHGAPGARLLLHDNWPPEPRVDNRPTANVVVWSVLSLIALPGGIGILFGAFGRWGFLGWHGREQATLSFRSPGDVALTPAQRASAWFFFVMAANVPDPAQHPARALPVRRTGAARRASRRARTGGDRRGHGGLDRGVRVPGRCPRGSGGAALRGGPGHSRWVDRWRIEPSPRARSSSPST